MVHFGGWWAHHAFLHSKFSAKLGTPLPPCVHYVIYELSLSKDDSNITGLVICVFYASHFMEKKKRKNIASPPSLPTFHTNALLVALSLEKIFDRKMLLKIVNNLTFQAKWEYFCVIKSFLHSNLWVDLVK